MISTGNFTEAFDQEAIQRIKKLWNMGKIREAQREAQQILERPANPKDKTLL
jgi:hypothetical protein